MATIVQYAEGVNFSSATATFGAGVTAGNLIVAVLISDEMLIPTMAAGSGYTHLGGVTAIARNAAGTDKNAIRIYGKVAAGGETAISREATGARIQINVFEISGADLADAVLVSLDRQDVATPALCDLGSFADAYGAAVVGMVLTRSNTGQWIGLSCVPVAGWTERSDRRIDTNPSGPAGPWQYVASAVAAGGTLDPAMTATIVTYAPQDIADFAGVAVLFDYGTAVAADFVGTPTSGDAPLSVAFTDLSSGTPNQWAWTFGDGGTSTSQNPTHEYAAAGTYSVTLTATRTSDASSDDATKLFYVTATEPPMPGVWVDWASDGTFNSAATSDDALLARMMPEARGIDDEITTDVHTIEWAYGGSSDHVSAASPGWARLTVQNADGKYNPDNASSTLYGYLKPGKRIWFGLNADGSATGTGQTVYGIFAGYIREIIPLVEGGATGLAEILCEDPLGSYARRPVLVAAATTYSYETLRTAILADIGETSYTLADEIDTLPLAAAESMNALSVLEDINQATGSRHWSNPADSKEDWQAYTVVDRHYKLEASADAAINADDVQAISGYRVTADNIINYQVADVSQAYFGAGVDTVWEYAEASFPVNTTKRTIWAQFDDFVKDAVLDYSSTGGAVTTTFTAFGTTAKIEIWSASSSVVQNLSIEGRMVVRPANEAVAAEDASSQVAYEKRVGPTISSEYSATPALAQGVVNYMVWKFAQPLKRPAITQIAEYSAILPRDLYDVITLTVDRLHVVARRFEIVGTSGSYESPKLLSVTWELQETPNQSALNLFVLDTDALDGPAILGR